MTRDFIDMLHLLGANYKYKIENDDHEYNIEKIKRLSLSQGIWTLVYPQLSRFASFSEDDEDNFTSEITYEVQKRIEHLELIEEMNSKGIKCCLIKGAAIAICYPQPDCRISSDTDILLLPEQEKEAVRFFEEKGFDVKPRPKNDHHFKAYGSDGDLIEGHVFLHSIPSAQILFNGVDLYHEEWTEENIEGFNIPIMGLNDGLIYLTAHYIKHFVNGGGGVRHMMDLLFYIEKYKDRLDFKSYYDTIRDLNYEKLVNVVKTVGAKYWGFDYPIVDEELADRILTDSEEGGIFGFDTDTRDGFNAEYCKRREKNRLRYVLLKNFKDEKTIIDRIFPNQDRLLKYGYSYAKNRMLVPAAWVHNWFNIVFRRMKRSGDTRVKGAKDARIKMMEDLGMI